MAGTGRHQQRRDQRLPVRIAMFRCHVSILVFLVGEAVCLSSHLQVHPRIGYPQVLEYVYCLPIFLKYFWGIPRHIAFLDKNVLHAFRLHSSEPMWHGSGRKHCEPRFSAFGRDPSAENSFCVELRRVVRSQQLPRKTITKGHPRMVIAKDTVSICQP